MPPIWAYCLSTVSTFRLVHSDIRQCNPAHSHHRYFIDPRPITRDRLRFVFAVKMFVNCQYSECVQSTSACCVSYRNLSAASSNAVSGGAFRGVTPSFHSSKYQLENQTIFRHFSLVAGYPTSEVICDNVSLHINRARLSMPPYFLCREADCSCRREY